MSEFAVRIIVDSREPPVIVTELGRLGVSVERRMITPGDFVLSSECAVERKTVPDFMNSLFTGRLFEQVTSLREAYARPLVIVEGNVESELNWRKNPRAFWGALLKIQAEMSIPVITAPTMRHTADVLYTLAKRLQKEATEKNVVVQHKPRRMSGSDWRLYIVSGLPNIGDELAGRLLAHFRSVRKIFLASRLELEEVDGIGGAKAEKICQLLDEEF